MKVIGAGFGRTGTLSLKLALEELGFGPCYHMTEVFRHKDHGAAWLARAEGKPVDWKAVFKDYQATVDWPACTYYQELMAAFPEAKVLLSVRDPEKWYESAKNTIFGSINAAQKNKVMPLLFPRLKTVMAMAQRQVWEGTFGGRFEDRAHAIEVFNRHTEEVKRVVPPERLLVFDVKQGWEPLCKFLGVPVPNKPFPRVNDTAEFQGRIKRRQRAAFGVLGAVAALIALGIYLAVR